MQLSAGVSSFPLTTTHRFLWHICIWKSSSDERKGHVNASAVWAHCGHTALAVAVNLKLKKRDACPRHARTKGSVHWLWRQTRFPGSLSFTKPLFKHTSCCQVGRWRHPPLPPLPYLHWGKFLLMANGRRQGPVCVVCRVCQQSSGKNLWLCHHIIFTRWLKHSVVWRWCKSPYVEHVVALARTCSRGWSDFFPGEKSAVWRHLLLISERLLILCLHPPFHMKLYPSVCILVLSNVHTENRSPTCEVKSAQLKVNKLRQLVTLIWSLTVSSPTILQASGSLFPLFLHLFVYADMQIRLYLCPLILSSWFSHLIPFTLLIASSFYLQPHFTSCRLMRPLNSDLFISPLSCFLFPV